MASDTALVEDFFALLCSRPSIVVQDGKILAREMVKNRFTVDELMEELRGAGVTDLNSVKYAVLETTGRISVIPKKEEQPPSAAELAWERGTMTAFCPGA